MKDVFVSDTMRARIEKLDKALRDAGFLSPLAPPLSECDEFVRLLVRARGEDYNAGTSGRAISTQMPAIPHPVLPRKPEEGDK
jgi:hypothetical protein